MFSHDTLLCQGQAALRQLAKEGEMEAEDPDRLYLEDDEEQDGKKKTGRGRGKGKGRGKGRGKGGKGRGKPRGRGGKQGGKDEKDLGEDGEDKEDHGDHDIGQAEESKGNQQGHDPHAASKGNAENSEEALVDRPKGKQVPPPAATPATSPVKEKKTEPSKELSPKPKSPALHRSKRRREILERQKSKTTLNTEKVDKGPDEKKGGEKDGVEEGTAAKQPRVSPKPKAGDGKASKKRKKGPEEEEEKEEKSDGQAGEEKDVGEVEPGDSAPKGDEATKGDEPGPKKRAKKAISQDVLEEVHQWGVIMGFHVHLLHGSVLVSAGSVVFVGYFCESSVSSTAFNRQVAKLEHYGIDTIAWGSFACVQQANTGLSFIACLYWHLQRFDNESLYLWNNFIFYGSIDMLHQN